MIRWRNLFGVVVFRTVLPMLIGLLLTMGSGCKEDDSRQDGAQLPKGPEGVHGEVLQAMCAMMDRCPNGAGYPIAYRSRAECVAILNFALTCRLVDKEDDRERTTFEIRQVEPEIDAEKAAACVEWLADTSCEVIESGWENAPCSEAFQGSEAGDDGPSGTAGVDEDCQINGDCQAELYCTPDIVDSDLGRIYCQVCKPRLDEGEPCTRPLEWCKEGLHCTYYDEGPALCSALKEDEAPCVDHEECQSGFCNHSLVGGGGRGLCDPAGHEGDPCRNESEEEGLGSDCRQRYFCDEGQCRPRRQNGEACTGYLQCETFACDEASGLCGIGDGEQCYDHYQCISEICSEGTCGGQPGACMSDEQCAEGEYCQGLCLPPNCECSGCPIGTCVPRNSAGAQECTDDHECPSFRCQEDGKCAPPDTIGSSCSNDFQCYPVGYCSGGVCVERHGPGQSCTRLDSCLEPFLCIQGKCEIMNLSCQPARAGQRCAYLRVCDDQSYCDLFDEVTCKPRARAGEPCVTSRIPGVKTCVTGHYCGATEEGEMICLAEPKAGEPCTGICADNAYCYGGICQAGPIGQSCGYSRPCPEELYCNDYNDSICLPRLGEGEQCDSWYHRHCQDAYYCGRSHTCELRLEVDEPCNDSEECASGFYCARSSWTCQPSASHGEECDHSLPCAEGLRCSSNERICEEAGAPGASCTSHADCLSGICYQAYFCLESQECVMP